MVFYPSLAVGLDHMSMQTTLSKTTSGIALKGGMFTLTTIQLLEYDLDELSQILDEKIEQAPNFFAHAPVIIDIQRINPAEEYIDLPSVVAILKSKKLIPIGLRGASKALKEIAMEIGLAIFPEEKVMTAKKLIEPKVATPVTTEPVASRSEAGATSGTRLITHPVRSGQQIYVPGGDLIVLASVSHGAELLADGNIHVYGSMRGRALAGVMGDKEAMIFCRSLEAELISIAGQYRLSEDLKETCWKQPACIQLVDGRLSIRPV